MKALAVFFDDRQSVPAHIKLKSPSPGKPKLVVDGWVAAQKPIELHSFDPVSVDDFKLAHLPSFVDDILNCRIENGFETRHPEVAAALPWTTGSFYAAARYAYINKTIACSPTSGFHHAEYAAAMGFCTFNGLIVAAMKLRQEFPDIQIGVVDCDHHYGNGTDNLIKEKGLDYVQHYTFGGCEAGNYLWNGLYYAKDWLERLPEILSKFVECDVIFYQAGADAHFQDPYGGALTTPQLELRDQIVFQFFGSRQIPVVWNLAGGYQTPISKVLEIHDNTLNAALKFLDNYEVRNVSD